MYRVAICDDDLQCAEEMKSYISEVYRADVFTTGREFLENDLENPYDVVILDIEMPELTGLEVAGNLQNTLDNRILIFASSHECYSIEAIKLHPFRYLRKHCLKEDLKEALEEAERQLQQTRVRCVVETGSRKEEFKLGNMLYAEVKNHNVRIYMQDSRGDLDMRMTMDELISQVKPASVIVRTHKSYIVNLYHVSGENGKEVYLDNGTKVPLSRGCKAVFREKYFDFVRK